MQQPLQITFEGLARSDLVEQAVRRHCAHLERFAGDIVSCRVVVDQQPKHQQQGRPFGVRIGLTLPGRHALEAQRVQNEDLRVALRDAFDDMKRQLEDLVRRRRGQQKHHEAADPGAATESDS